MKTLRLAAFADYHTATLNDLYLLAWMGEPEGAYIGNSDRDMLNGDVEFGDEDCDALPSLPDAPGLWVLAWDYQMVRSEWADEDDDEPEMTAKYASHCQWTRPTMDDLIAFGLLPQEPRS